MIHGPYVGQQIGVSCLLPAASEYRSFRGLRGVVTTVGLGLARDRVVVSLAVGETVVLARRFLVRARDRWPEG